MLKAKLDSARKNKKGFSLVELIIVIAIMVALIAVMAPQFVKYVKSSREATLQQAAEDTLSTAKAEYALGNLQGTGTITIQKDTAHNDAVGITVDGLTYATGYTQTDFVNACGIDSSKKIASNTVWTITVTGGNENPTFNMVSSTAAG